MLSVCTSVNPPKPPPHNLRENHFVTGVYTCQVGVEKPDHGHKSRWPETE